MDLTPPSETGLDKAHAIVKTAASAATGWVPGVGPALQFIVDRFFDDPLHHREQQWKESVAAAIGELQQRYGVDIEELAMDQGFIDTVHEVIRAGVKTSQEEKLEALRNAVINSALPGAPEADIRNIFVRLVSDFTPTHLRLLTVFSDPLGAIKSSGKFSLLPRRQSKMSGAEVAKLGLSGLVADDSAVFDTFASELITNRLVNGDLHRGVEIDSSLRERTSGLGDSFLAFITPPASLNAAEAKQMREAASRLEDVRKQLQERAKSFSVNQVRTRRIADYRVLHWLLIRYPRDAAGNRLMNGNYLADQVDAWLTPTRCIFEVLVWDARGERIAATIHKDFSVQEGFRFDHVEHDSADRCADRILLAIEVLFGKEWPPDHA